MTRVDPDPPEIFPSHVKIPMSSGCFFRRFSRGQEVEITAAAGLGHMVVEHAQITAHLPVSGPGMSRPGDVQVHLQLTSRLSVRSGAFNVIISPLRTRASGPPTGGFRAGMQNNGTESGAAHAGIRDANHILDTLLGQLARDRDIAGLRHSRSTARACISHDENVVAASRQDRDRQYGWKDLRATRRRQPDPCEPGVLPYLQIA